MANTRNNSCPCGSGKKYKKCCLKLFPKSSCDYLNNNFEIVKFYKELYRDRIDIDKLIKQVEGGIFSTILLRDLFRFRVFIDSAMLLFNREKLEREFFKDKFIYSEFFKTINEDEVMKEYLSFYRIFLSKHFSYQISQFDKFYIPYDNKENVRPYNQLARVRNALAHMNYGHFIFSEGFKYGFDYLIGYNIYNRSKQDSRSINHGFILEPVLHRFIQSYFSNYTSYGIVYKHTWFSISTYDNVKNLLNSSLELKVNVLTYKSNKKYDGREDHDMIAFTKKFKILSHDELLCYIHDNNDKFEYAVRNISNCEINSLLKFVNKELGRDVSYDEFSHSIKFLYDFETEFSNFLVHLMQLNDRLIDYSAPFISRDEENISKILYSISELKEDELSWVAFKYMFPLLNVINICLRIEDDDLFEINPKNVDVGGFLADSDNIGKYIENNPDIKDTDNIDRFYILERLRNSVAHGHISLNLSSENNIVYEFTDIWNKREETISISYSELNRFIGQSLFRERK